METPYGHHYNAVILPVTPAESPGGLHFQVSANRNDRAAPRYLSPIWSIQQLRAAFARSGIDECEFQELLRGNRRASGGREARRLLFTEAQLQAMDLVLDLPPDLPTPDAGEQPAAAVSSSDL